MAASAILILFSSVFAVESKHYFHGHSLTSWVEAKDNCSLARPAIADFKKMKLDLGDFKTTGEYWVGYVKVKRVFQYHGCVQAAKFESYGAIDMKNKTVGMCYSICTISKKKYKFIGIEGKKCYCVTKLTGSDTHDKCDESCETPKGTACGQTGYTSLYYQVDGPQQTHDYGADPGDCLTTNRKRPRVWSWANCERFNIVTCAKGNTAIIGIDNDASWSNSYQPWLQSSNLCFGIGRRPILANFIILNSNPSQVGGLLWTGMIRSDVISTDIDHFESLEHGYVSASNELMFTNEGSAEKIPLCKTDDSDPTGSEDKQPDDGNSGSVNVYVGVAIALVIVFGVAAVATICIVRKRKKHTSDEAIQMAQQNPGYIDPAKIFGSEPRGDLQTTEQNDIRVSNYERIHDGVLVLDNADDPDADIDVYNVIHDVNLDRPDNDNTAQNVYFKLEKTDSTPEHQAGGYDEESANAYDKTGHVSRKPEDTDHVYNKATFPDNRDSGDTYNHTADNNWKQDEGAYNKIGVPRETIGGDNEAAHNIATMEGQKTANICGDDDDTYSKAKF